MEDFKDAVNELFVLEDQDRKTLIRRFLCGLISSPDSDAGNYVSNSDFYI